MSRRKITRHRDPGLGTLRRGTNKKGQKVWYGDWIDANGKRHRAALSADKRVAERKLAEMIKERDEILTGVAPRLDVDIEVLKDRYLESAVFEKKPSYVRKLKTLLPRVIAALGATTVKDVSKAAVSAYCDARLRDGAARSTINGEVSALRGMLTWAANREIIGVHPLAGMSRLQQREEDVTVYRRALSDGELDTFLRGSRDVDDERAALHAAEKTILGGTKGRSYESKSRQPFVRQTPLWRTLILTGMRFGEARTLDWGDVDLDARMLTLRAENTKNRKSRSIPLVASVVADLSALRNFYVKVMRRTVSRDEPVFLAPSGEARIDHANTNRLFHVILKRAEIKKKADGKTVVIHSLRHSFCSMLARRGVPMIEAQKLMGHGDIRLTARIYAQVDKEDLRGAVETLPELGGKEVWERKVAYQVDRLIEGVRRAS